MTTARKISRHGALWHRPALALILVIALCLVITSPARAQDLADFFKITYDPVTFDKVEITGEEVFHATLTGRASCAKDLPLPASEATITAQVIGRHNDSGDEVTLNAGYTLDIKPFPDKAGDIIEIE